ncbi:hypothetical protein CB0940_12071 [Cercospora beticola]|uniref:Uncharacterized protein n=1 Tax=Cercospora beticola TaxID=122368 RepID=A0A2G5IE74_CERBT|nr:hypothetical protein CB0940_12071 [Cercospora beticola]PIB03156.1 hypothetical protein CB0940_12071 [Cercospora beticola]
MPPRSYELVHQWLQPLLTTTTTRTSSVLVASQREISKLANTTCLLLRMNTSAPVPTLKRSRRKLRRWTTELERSMEPRGKKAQMVGCFLLVWRESLNRFAENVLFMLVRRQRK